MAIISIVNQKGGVGKTTTAVHSGFSLAKENKFTLLLDLEPSRNTSKVFCNHITEPNIVEVFAIKNFDIKEAIQPAMVKNSLVNNLSIIQSRQQLGTIDFHKRVHKEKILAKQLHKISDLYEYILLDCPPMQSDLSNNAIFAADYIIIPIRYESDALDGVNDLFTAIKEIKEDEPIKYKILRTGLDNRKKTVISYVDDVLRPFEEKGLVFKTIIAQDEEINKAKVENEPVFTYAPKTIGALNYHNLTKEIIEWVKN